ncbi:hypothetical protein ACI3KS_04255 [Microbacterium sp. ZW T5_45]|uniref:DsrE family protein n=1 Tax=Microbacterium sp. ZW T5_45 TaxID=3378080 RepID=UPI0038534C44
MKENQSRGRAVVIHAFDAPEDVPRAVGTASTLREAFPDARVRIIVNGAALGAVPALAPEDVPDGVEVGVCRIGLHRRNIDEADIPDGVEIIPTAPVAIVEEQWAGAAYIRL